MVSFTKWSINIGWRIVSQVIVRQSPVRLALSIGSNILQRRVKFKVDTWLGRRQTKLFKGVKLSIRKSIYPFRKSIRWVRKKSRSRARRTMSEEAGIHDVMLLDAGMKYKDLAEKRISTAKTAFEAASHELKDAERGLREATNYVNGLKKHCNKIHQHETDIVFVEHARDENVHQNNANKMLEHDLLMTMTNI